VIVWFAQRFHEVAVRTVLLHKPGGPDVLEVVERPLPAPGPANVLIRTRAMAVSRPDILIRTGAYSWMPPLPASPGNELTGVIEAVGDGVQTLRVGQAVLLSARDLPVRGGCYTDAICVPADAVYPLPDGIDFDQAVVLPSYLVAYAMLQDMGLLQQGVRSIFVTGAAGSVGGALVELAKAEGLTVIGSTGSDEKAAHARSLGADHTINYKSEPVVQRVLALTDGRGVDVVFDHIIGPDFADLLGALADYGTLVFYNIHTPMPDDDVYGRMRELSTRSPALRCFNIHTYDRHPERRRQLMRRLIDLLADGKIKPRIGAHLAMSQAADAHRLLEAGTVVGKIVLHP
jgi:NADPH2:quinone reductase